MFVQPGTRRLVQELNACTQIPYPSKAEGEESWRVRPILAVYVEQPHTNNTADHYHVENSEYETHNRRHLK